MKFQELKTMDERLLFMSELAQRFLKRSALIDEEASFPFESISELKSSGYTSLTLPKKYGRINRQLNIFL